MDHDQWTSDELKETENIYSICIKENEMKIEEIHIPLKLKGKASIASSRDNLTQFVQYLKLAYILD